MENFHIESMMMTDNITTITTPITTITTTTNNNNITTTSTTTTTSTKTTTPFLALITERRRVMLCSGSTFRTCVFLADGPKRFPGHERVAAERGGVCGVSWGRRECVAVVWWGCERGS